MSKIVLVENDGTNRDATYEDLKQHHPKCYECSLQKGVHGKIGQEVVFCKIWDLTVDKNGYCNSFTP